MRKPTQLLNELLSETLPNSPPRHAKNEARVQGILDLFTEKEKDLNAAKILLAWARPRLNTVVSAKDEEEFMCKINKLLKGGG